MNSNNYITKAQQYLEALCTVKPNRRTGSDGNKEAVRMFAETVKSFGYETDETNFPAQDYFSGRPVLQCGKKEPEVFTSPYSLEFDKRAELAVVSTVEELEKCECKGKILLLLGEICSEQLMPKNFVFYNPDHHKEIYALLESKQPAAIITATAKNAMVVGSLYPFPLICDGDFDIPSVYCTDIIGLEIAKRAGETIYLKIPSKRSSTTANNVIAIKNPNTDKKITVCAHIDAYENAPGALDNASGTATLLLLAEMLKDNSGKYGVEIIAFNGEDHYSAGGQMDYLRRYGNKLDRIALAVNIDDIGYIKGNTAFSSYELSNAEVENLRKIFSRYKRIVEGEQWYQGDHMIFVQKQIPAIAFTSDCIIDLMSEITHSERDVPELVDCGKLVETAEALKEMILKYN